MRRRLSVTYRPAEAPYVEGLWVIHRWKGLFGNVVPCGCTRSELDAPLSLHLKTALSLSFCI